MNSSLRRVTFVAAGPAAVIILALIGISCTRGEFATAAGAAVVAEEVDAAKGLPRLVDLGRGACIPCKRMAPLLAELRIEYEGRAVVEFIDVGVRPAAAREYRIRLIPTQVFIDHTGREIGRHEGFLDKPQMAGVLDDLIERARRAGEEP